MLEEGVQRLDSGGTVRDEAAVEVHQPNKLSQFALCSKEGEPLELSPLKDDCQWHPHDDRGSPALVFQIDFWRY